MNIHTPFRILDPESPKLHSFSGPKFSLPFPPYPRTEETETTYLYFLKDNYRFLILEITANLTLILPVAGYTFPSVFQAEKLNGCCKYLPCFKTQKHSVKFSFYIRFTFLSGGRGNIYCSMP